MAQLVLSIHATHLVEQIQFVITQKIRIAIAVFSQFSGKVSVRLNNYIRQEYFDGVPGFTLAAYLLAQFRLRIVWKFGPLIYEIYSLLV